MARRAVFHCTRPLVPSSTQMTAHPRLVGKYLNGTLAGYSNSNRCWYVQENYAPNSVFIIRIWWNFCSAVPSKYEYTIRLAITAKLNVNEVFGTGVDGRHDVESVFCCAAVPVWLIVCGVTLLLLHRLFWPYVCCATWEKLRWELLRFVWCVNCCDVNKQISGRPRTMDVNGFCCGLFQADCQ